MSSTMKAAGVSLAATAVAAMLALAVAPAGALAQTVIGALNAQTSVDRGVTVKVTPKTIAPAGGRWEFSVVFDTHSAELNDDVAAIAELATADGRTLKPAAWTGAAPGGHHREGSLEFDVPPPMPAAVELRIARPGESAARTFRWTF